MKKAERTYRTVHPVRPINMAANETSSDAVVVLPYKYDGKEGRTEIVGTVSREDDKGSKKSIIEMDEAALPLGEGDKKLSREKTVEELVEALLCEYGEGTRKESSEMDVEALPLEKDADKSNSNKNIDAVSTEEVKNARSENLEALHTEDDTKYARSENMLQEDVK